MKYIIVLFSLLILTGCDDHHKCPSSILNKGMTTDDVIKVCGKPNVVYGDIYQSNKRETYQYDNGATTSGDYVSFRNGMIYDSSIN